MTQVKIDHWWVIGSPGKKCYMCRTDIGRCYYPTNDPNDAERFGTEQAAENSLQDEDVREWTAEYPDAKPMRVTQGTSVTDEADGSVPRAPAGRRRAKLLYCMDYLIRSLSDEDEHAWWLEEGVPDGTMEADLSDMQTASYEDLNVSDEDFNIMAGIFAKTMMSAVFAGASSTSTRDVRPGVFA